MLGAERSACPGRSRRRLDGCRASVLPRPLAAPARRRRGGADGGSSEARARLHAGRARVPAGQRVARAGARVRGPGCASGSRSCGATRGAASSSDPGSFSGRSASSGSCRSPSCTCPRTVRRTAHALAAVLVAGVVAGIHGSAIPFSGQNGSRRWGSPGATTRSRSSSLSGNGFSSNPALGIEALILAATAGCAPVRDAPG